MVKEKKFEKHPDHITQKVIAENYCNIDWIK